MTCIKKIRAVRCSVYEKKNAMWWFRDMQSLNAMSTGSNAMSMGSTSR